MRGSRAITFGFAATLMFSAGALAQGSHLGTIIQVEEAKGTITVSEAWTGATGSTAGSAARPNTEQEYKLQDGLLFDALDVGDVVSFTVEQRNGVKTITNLQEK